MAAKGSGLVLLLARTLSWQPGGDRGGEGVWLSGDQASCWWQSRPEGTQPPAPSPGWARGLAGRGRQDKGPLCSGSGLLPDGTRHRKPQGPRFLGQTAEGPTCAGGYLPPGTVLGRRGGPRSLWSCGLRTGAPLRQGHRLRAARGSSTSSGFSAHSPRSRSWLLGHRGAHSGRDGWRLAAPAQPSLGTVPHPGCQAQDPCSPLLTLRNVRVLTGRWAGPVTPLLVEGRPGGPFTT